MLNPSNPQTPASQVLTLGYASIQEAEQRQVFRTQYLALLPDQRNDVLYAQSAADLSRLLDAFGKLRDQKPAEMASISQVLAHKQALSSEQNNQEQHAAKARLNTYLNPQLSTNLASSPAQAKTSPDALSIKQTEKVLYEGKNNLLIRAQAAAERIILHKDVDSVTVAPHPDQAGMFNVTVHSVYHGVRPETSVVSKAALENIVQSSLAQAAIPSVTQPTPSASVDNSASLLIEKFSETRQPENFLIAFNKLPTDQKQTVLAQQRLGDLQMLAGSRQINDQDRRTMNSMITSIQTTPISAGGLVKQANRIMQRGTYDTGISNQAARIGVTIHGSIESVEVAQHPQNQNTFIITTNPSHRGVKPVSTEVSHAELEKMIRSCLTPADIATIPKAALASNQQLPVTSQPKAPVIDDPKPETNHQKTVSRFQNAAPSTTQSNQASPPHVGTARAESTTFAQKLAGWGQKTEKLFNELQQSCQNIVASKGTDINAASRFQSCIKQLNEVKKDIKNLAQYGTADEQRQSQTLFNKIETGVKSLTASVTNFIKPQQPDTSVKQSNSR